MGRKLWLWFGAIALAAAIAAGGYVAFGGPLAYARIAVTYGAKQTCTCHFVSGRALEACIGDYPEQARRHIGVAVSGERVRASIYGVISAEAVYEDGFGCRIDG